MKTLKTIAVACAITLLSCNANAANPILSALQNPQVFAQQTTQKTKPLLVIHFAPSESFFANTTFDFLAGTSQTQPCSDLELVDTSTHNFFLMDVALGFDAKLLDLGFANGDAPVTCFRLDLTVDEKNYSTGNIELTWDSKAGTYTKATPDYVELDIQK